MHIILTIIIIIGILGSSIPVYIKAQSTTQEIFPAQDIFVSSSTDKGNRRMLFIGKYTDYTATGVPTYFNSQALIKFNLPGQQNILIESAELKIYHYGSNANVDIQVARITGTWNETSFYPGPAIEGNYGGAYIPYFNTNYSNNIKVRTISLSQDLFTKMTLENYGLAIIPRNGSNALGMVICSGNTDTFCLPQHRPKLVIRYRINNSPSIPVLTNPVNSATFSGNCNESATPATGICRRSIPVNFKLGNVGDVDPYPGNLKYTIINFSSNNKSYNSDPIGGSGNISYTSTKLNDGVITWKAYSQDNLGQKSGYSQNFIFTVDTTPPRAPLLKGISQQDANSILILLIPSQDNLTAPQNLLYIVEYSSTTDFQNAVFQKNYNALGEMLKLGNSGFDNISENKDDLKPNTSYYFRIKSVDALNNTSAWSNIISSNIKYALPTPVIDKTPPETPEILFLDFCNLKICLDIKGEASTTLIVNDSVMATMPAQGILRNLILKDSWVYGELYQYIIKLKDKAGNESQEINLKLQAPIVGDGKYEGDKDNTFADKNLDTYPPTQLEIEIDGQNNAKLLKFELPAPIVTYAQKDPLTKDIDIWGIALAKNFAFPVTVNITKHSLTYGEASVICKSNIPAFFWDYQCLSKTIGLSLVKFIKFDAESWWQCNLQNPFFWQRDSLINCLRNKRITNTENIKQNILFPHVELQAFKNAFSNITGSRFCAKDVKCSVAAERFWNDNAKGEWNMRFAFEELRTGDKFFTKAIIYGPLTINFYEQKITIALPDNGIPSSNSNVIMAPKFLKSDFISPTDIYCGTAHLTSEYGLRRLKKGDKMKLHDGVDIANHGKGCLLNPIGDGKVANINNSYGNTVIIIHNNGFKSIYGHNAEIYIKITDNVTTTTKISYMGQTGNATGIHVHLRLDKDGAPKDSKGNRTVDPKLYIILPKKL